MDHPRPVTVFGFLGTQVDQGFREDRWERWRPTVALCQHEDLLVEHLVLFSERVRDRKLCAQVTDDIALVSPETRVERIELELRNPWDFEEVYEVLHRYCTGFPFDPERHTYLLHMTTGTHVTQICSFLLAETRHFPASLLQTVPPGRDARSRGAAGSYQIIDLDLSRYDRIAQRFADEHAQGQALLKSGIATRNEAFNDQVRQIEQVALASSAPILLLGPTGAGKSQLAARIYALKKQRHKTAERFVEVNCATLRGDQAMAALFGHVKGAFTGAQRDRPGLLRTADGGILFLDEIGELGLDEQAMLLRALEEGKFLPVGADREVESRFQLVAGTNCDLGERVAAGTFREDLLARINLWTFRLPGLGERREDIEPNVDYELAQFAAREGRKVAFSREARARYLAFATGPEGHWRGNFRDLNASVTRLATLCRGGRITRTDVDRELARLRADWRHAAGPADAATADAALLRGLLGDEAVADLDLFDVVQLAEVVRTCQRSPTLSAAGRILFAASRRARSSTNDADRVRKYLRRFGLDFAAVNRAPAQPGP